MIRINWHINLRWIFRLDCWFIAKRSGKDSLWAGHDYQDVIGYGLEPSFAYCRRCGKGWRQGHMPRRHVRYVDGYSVPVPYYPHLRAAYARLSGVVAFLRRSAWWLVAQYNPRNY